MPSSLANLVDPKSGVWIDDTQPMLSVRVPKWLRTNWDKPHLVPFVTLQRQAEDEEVGEVKKR